MRGRRLLLVLVAAIASLALASGCSGQKSGGTDTETTSEPPSRLADLNAVDDLRTAFNAKPDVPRLILLLSPT